MFDGESVAVPIDEESILIYYRSTNEGERKREKDPGLLHRFRSYLQPRTSFTLLPIYHHHRRINHHQRGKGETMSISDYSETNANENENWKSNTSNTNQGDYGTGYALSDPARTDFFTPMEDALPSLSTEQQQELNKRRRRSLAGKVKASVARPARAVGRRVFKNRYSSKVDVLGGREEVDLNRDIINKTPDDIFRTNPLDRDAARILNGRSKNSDSTNSLRRSLSQIMCKRSTSRAGTIVNGNDAGTSSPTAFVALANESDDTDWPVRSVEAIARNAALLCVVYVMGALHPDWSAPVLRLLEFLLTVWVTCLLILALGWLRKSNIPEHHQHQYASPLRYADNQRQWQWQRREGDPEMAPLVQHPDRDETSAYGTSTIADAECATNSNENCSENKLSLSINTAAIRSESQNADGVVVESSSSSDEADISFTKKQKDQEMNQEVEHPKLVSFYVVDSKTGERVMCNNGSTPFRISNEWVEMDMVAMMRTPDADYPDAKRGSTANDKISEHFRGLQRRFEFQYRVKLKKVPVGKQLYFSCELDDPVKMGIVTKAFVSAAMAFVRTTNPTFHYNITGSKKKTSDGKYETPHMSFTVEASLDRFVVTKPGETPPELGSKIYEDPESIKKRKSGKPTDWNTEDTYTMAIWSSYVDFLDWRVRNLPGIKPFGLANVLGTQAINLTMYLIDADMKGDSHYRKDITEIIKLEFSNGEHSGVGKEAKKWINAKAPGQQHRETELTGAVLGSPFLPIGHCASEDSVGVDENTKQTALLGTNDTMDEMDEIDKDTADAAELGEGIYLRSGDSVFLREFLSEDEKSTACTVINGGGFAVLSKRNVPIVIEKTKRSKKNKLIKSGDTVMFKMIQNKPGTDDNETRYLTIHRGWWLKWVTTMPLNNGYFTIFTHETELGERALPTDETQSSFLTLGGSFSLRHKRWSRYAVGVSAEPSTDFGGRMLSLYNSKRNKGAASMEEEKQQAATYQSDDEGDIDKEMPSIGETGYIKPLVLCTQDPQSLMVTSPKSPTKPYRLDDSSLEKAEPQTPNGLKLLFSSDHSHADVPAWIEMMDRKQRVRQLAYVVRIVHRTPGGDDKQATTHNNEDIIFTRLKSGKDLARIMNIGQSMKIPHVVPKTLAATAISSGSDADNTNDNAFVKSKSYPSLSTDAVPNTNGSGEGDAGIITKKNNLSFPNVAVHILNASGEGDVGIVTKKSTSSECSDGYELYENPGVEIDEDEAMTPTKYENDNSMLGDGYIEGDSMSESSSSDTEAGAHKKNRLRKLKRLGKKTVVGTSRITKKTALAAKGLRGTGKATGKVVATTGKKLIAPVSIKSGKQPRKEPKKRNKEPQTGISRKMKKLGKKIEAKSGGPPIFVAGELSATEQSRRTASRVLERMSTVPMQSSAWKRCNDALSSELGFMTDQDTWFLDGDAVHLGIKPSKKHGKLLEESVVARCLWESHWREEWCGMYESSLSFYAPLARSTCHEIFYSDITFVRLLVVDSLCPLPGFSVLVVETAWQCHYMAFRDETSRDTFGDKVDRAVKSYKAKQQTDDLEKNELQKARFWQGFQTLSETSLAAGAAKWAKVSSNQKSKERAILNGRRMAFDSLTMSFGGSVSKAYKFVENLLTTALTFSFKNLEQDPESFIDFLDSTSELRFLPLGEIDLSSPYAFCMFVNIYHCLLQQALLLSVNGSLHKKSISHFMRTSCYEIGGDVFSLAELHSCVICGKMSKPINPKPPYVEAPKKSNAYKYYALNYTDVRVHFVLNTSDMACPASVPVLSQRYIEQQLHAACVDFFRNRQLLVDTKRRIITMPKVCEIRRNDFGNGEILNVLKICMDEMDSYLGNSIREVIEKGGKGLTIKFQPTQEQYHSSLRLATAATNRNLEMEYYDGILESNSTEQDS